MSDRTWQLRQAMTNMAKVTCVTKATSLKIWQVWPKSEKCDNKTYVTKGASLQKVTSLKSMTTVKNCYQCGTILQVWQNVITATIYNKCGKSYKCDKFENKWKEWQNMTTVIKHDKCDKICPEWQKVTGVTKFGNGNKCDKFHKSDKF